MRGGARAAVERALIEGTARWLIAFALILALHVGGGAYLMSRAREALDGLPGDAIAVEIVPDVASPDATPSDVSGVKADDPDPPAPDAAPPTQTKPTIEKTPEVTAPPSLAKAEAVLPKPEDRPPDPKPPDAKPPDETIPDAKKDTVEHQATPSQAAATAELLEGGRRLSAAAKATWSGEIGSHIGHHRRYPRQARAQGWQGVARVSVTIDGAGHVLGRTLLASTGRPVLDDEALALMQRCDPFPKPPASLRVPVTLTVPVNFGLR